jgi:hypothetical protein
MTDKQYVKCDVERVSNEFDLNQTLSINATLSLSVYGSRFRQQITLHSRLWLLHKLEQFPTILST